MGAIPAHWEMRRLKFLANDINQQRVEIGEDEVYLQLENIEGWTGRYTIPEDTVSNFESAAKAFQPDDVLFGKLRPYLAKVIVSKHYGACVGELLVLRVRENTILPKFLALRLLTKEFIDVIDASTYGAKMPRANWGFIGNLEIPFPPDPDEQRAIAAFLDRQTAKIDALIAKKRELIAALHEQRSAIISHAVTKGLNPDAPMKDSGIEWLGAIPSHWDAPRVKMVARLESGHTPSRSIPEYWENCTIPWVSLADVGKLRSGKTDYIFETEEKISELGLANSAARLLPARTVILSRTASVGFSAILGVPMATTQDFVNWICGDNLIPEFLLLCFRAMKQEFESLTMGSTHQTIYMPDVARFRIPLPPLAEQRAIINHINREIRQIDVLIAKTEETIERLQEYRAALISAAVTGKIDVRGA
ncbi:restriction endonuclease subunit S [Kamptonema cortianum]|nr:restriction endonuclease subunit S [Kamptonema cortianum]